MKVAIEFYGHLRSFRETHPSIVKCLVSQFENPDIFIHTWDKTDHSNITWHNLDGIKRGTDTTEDDIKFLKKNYNPKRIQVEKQISLSEDRVFKMIMTENDTPFSMIKNVFYTKWKANQLRIEYQKESKVEYDFVIQARLDLYFRKDFRISDYINYKTVIKKNPIEVDLSNKFFYASDDWIKNHGSNDILYSGGSDVLYFAKPSVMDKVLSIYELLDRIDLQSHYYSNEYLIFYSSISSGIEMIQINFNKDVDFGILRTGECLEYLQKSIPKGVDKKKSKLRGRKKLIREISRILKQLANFLEKRI